jgi:tRNA pseudouridine55 synthase
VPTRDAVEAALVTLRGEYLQAPPAYSAKKVGGERAHALARQERAVALTPVPVRVSRATLLEFTGTSAHVAITASAGFYVRSFAQTLGERVGTPACLESLRRTRSGEFTLDQAVSLEDLLESPDRVEDRWIPIDRLLSSLPAVPLGEEGCRRVAHGQAVGPAHAVTGALVPVAHEPAGPRSPGPAWVRLVDADGRLLAIATPDPSVDAALHPAVVLI